jgi:diaminopimelate decarboxylase
LKKHFKYENGKLLWGLQSIDLQSYLNNYHNPVYFYDIQLIASRFLEMKNQLRGVDIFYAMKANPHIDILKKLKTLGCKVDVVSGGEINRALSVGFFPQDIVFSGVGKTISEINLAFDLQILQINVESLPELERIIKISQQKNKPISIALRLNPNVDIKTHPYIATGLQENKFGIDISQLDQAINLLRSQTLVELAGVSLHLGSQMQEFSGFQQALLKLKSDFLSLQKYFPTCKKFDVGGGLGIRYEETDLEWESQSLQNYSEIIFSTFRDVKAQLQTEPGRWLVAHAGVLVCQVQYIKQTPFKEFVVLDSGMNHLIRPAFYQAFHQILPLQQKNGPEKVYDFVGPICESSDFFAKNRKSLELRSGDFVAVLDCGAYASSMSSIYNLKDPAAEVCL